MNDSLRTWDPLAPKLASRFHVVALDWPGRGGMPSRADLSVASLVADVAGVVAELGLAAPILWGHSVGGFIGLQYAAAHPCRTVLCEDSGWGYPPDLIDPDGIERIRSIADEPHVERHLRAAVLETMRVIPDLMAEIRCNVHLVFARGLDAAVGNARRDTERRTAGLGHVHVTWIESDRHDLHTAHPRRMLATLAAAVRRSAV